MTAPSIDSSSSEQHLSASPTRSSARLTRSSTQLIPSSQPLNQTAEKPIDSKPSSARASKRKFRIEKQNTSTRTRHPRKAHQLAVLSTNTAQTLTTINTSTMPRSSYYSTSGSSGSHSSSSRDQGKNSQSARQHKTIRHRIHWECEYCRLKFGSNKICAGCGHEQCSRCPRTPEARTSSNQGGNHGTTT